MKKLILLLFLLILTMSSFAASELDSLLTDEEDTFSELLTDENGLEPKDVFVEQLIGEAFLQHVDSDKWFQIIENTAIKEKDTVITMENSSMRVRMEDETFINVGAKTKLYFDTLRGKPDEELISETGLKLAFGKVFSKVRKRVETGGKYEVEAGSIVAGVRGTQYLTELSKKGEVSVKVYEGNVFVVPVEVHRSREAARKKAQAEKKETSGKDAEKEKTTEAEITAEKETEVETETEITTETTEETEVVLGANEVIVVTETNDWNIDVHNEAAPVELEATDNVTEEITEIKKEAGITETEEETTVEEETAPDEGLSESLLETVNKVEEQAATTVEETTESSASTIDVKVNIR